MENLYLIDAYALIYRSYFAFLRAPLRAPDGSNVSAVFGFFKTVFQLWDTYKPRYCAAVFDSKTPTFRHELFVEYKANREKAPEDLHAQVPIIEEILAKLKIPSLRMDGYEADDIIATLSNACSGRQTASTILSGDKDLLQLVNSYTQVLKPDKDRGFVEINTSGVEELWGVKADQILDYLSLTGDASDNVPGVAGVGDKTAQKLIHQFGTLDNILMHTADISPESLRAKIIAGTESAKLSRKLITLHTQVPGISCALESYAVPELDHEATRPLFEALGMKSLIRKKRGEATLFDTGSSSTTLTETTRSEAHAVAASQLSALNNAPVEEAAALSGDPAKNQESGKSLLGMGYSLHPDLPPSYSCPGTYEAVLTQEGLTELVKACVAKKIFSFDTETDSLDEFNARPVGFSVAVEPCKAWYVPVVSPDAECLPEATLREAIRPLFEDPGMLVVGQNLKFDYHILENWGIKIRAKPWDTMIAAWLLDPEFPSLKLEQLGSQFLGYSGIPYDTVVQKGKVFSDVPLEQALSYAAEDADMALRLWSVLEPLLKKEGLFCVFSELEMPLLPILAAMERRGILIHKKELEAFGIELDAWCGNLEKEAYKLAGHEFNINSPKQLQVVLFEERKLSPGKKTKTGYSTDISVLEELAALDPLPEIILRYRTLQKLKNTYVDTLPAQTGVDGRLHTHYVQSGTATGRLSSRDPNLQNIPVREEEGNRIRSAFSASPGSLLVSADYSQIELVVLAHLSEDPALSDAFRSGKDVHARTASLLFHKSEDSITPQERRAAKTINFGVIYGMSAFRLARDLKISRTEAAKFIEEYFKTYSGISRFIEACLAKARADGFVRTLFGRRRIIRSINGRNGTERQAAERIAINTPIQGTAADIVKKAMLSVAKMLEENWPEARLLLQVHDELIVEVPEAQAPALAAALKTCMESAWQLSVPLRADVSMGKTWGDMQ